MMSRASRSISTGTALLGLLVVVTVQFAGLASAWRGLGLLRFAGGAQHPQAGQQVEQVVPAALGVHRVPGAASADMQLRRSEQERAVTRTTFPSQRGRFLSGAAPGRVHQVSIRPASLRLVPAQTCDKVPTLCPESTGTQCCKKKCVDTLTDKNNCGGCGIKAGQGCACCSGKVADLRTDVQNCGICGNVCRGAKPVCSYSICNYNTAPY